MAFSFATLSLLAKNMEPNDLALYFLSLSALMLIVFPLNGALEGYLNKYISNLVIAQSASMFWVVVKSLSPLFFFYLVLALVAFTYLANFQDQFSLIQVLILICFHSIYYFMQVCHKVLNFASKNIITATFADSILKPVSILGCLIFFEANIINLFWGYINAYVISILFITLYNLRYFSNAGSIDKIEEKGYFTFLINNMLITFAFQIPIWLAEYQNESVAAVGIAMRCLSLFLTVFVVASNLYASDIAKLGRIKAGSHLLGLYQNYSYFIAGSIILTISIAIVLMPTFYSIFFKLEYYEYLSTTFILALGLILFRGFINPVSNFIIGLDKTYFLNITAIVSCLPYVILFSMPNLFSSILAYGLHHLIIALIFLFTLRSYSKL